MFPVIVHGFLNRLVCRPQVRGGVVNTSDGRQRPTTHAGEADLPEKLSMFLEPGSVSGAVNNVLGAAKTLFWRLQKLWSSQ